jgi:hypothetical protein
MKKVYIFDGESGEFLEKRDAFLSPIGGDPLLPVNGTFLPPPPVAAGEVAIFRNGKWHVVQDFRGRDTFDWSTQLIRKINEFGSTLKPLDDATAAEYAVHPDYYRLSNGTIAKLSDGEIEKLEI